ncbi:MAG: hypothetical protein M1830_009254 [Pleopsidium flavum]|nr:MAG: hypothetical protein M1830_000462 [Pleopsidium flavum]KAI9874805.1 MAG: hypothetical protein M1830_009254 [Pleopsidium flavum]
MTDHTMQDIAAAYGDDELTSQLENIPLLASPDIENYLQSITNQASPTMTSLLEELFEEPAQATSYPSPTPQPLTDPYPLTQQGQAPSQPINDWPSPIDLSFLDDYPNTNISHAGQIPFDYLPAIAITDAGQIPFNLPSTQHNAPIVDPSFLLCGSQLPYPMRHFTPLPQQGRNQSTGSDSSNPEDLALSDFETEVEESPRPNKTRKIAEGAKSGLKPITRGAGVDRQKPWIKTNSTKGKNSRAAKIADYKPEDHYTALTCTPPSWQDFSYISFGELEAGRTYSAAQLNRYLFEHPLHQTPNGFNSKASGLQLRIQKNPADSARRYPTYTSSRCRFEKCFGKNNCINQGQYRVAFDEQTFRDANTDPQHNAGYVHLYCLEKHLDFPLICATLNIRVEKRSLPKEPDARNRMRLGKSAALEEVAKDFIKTCETGELPADYPPRNHWRHEGTLTHKLCLAKVEEDGPHRLKAIQERGEKGSIYTQHLGNLEMESKERAKTRKPQNQQKSKALATRRKRKYIDEETDDDEANEEEIAPRRTTRRARARR